MSHDSQVLVTPPIETEADSNLMHKLVLAVGAKGCIGPLISKVTRYITLERKLDFLPEAVHCRPSYESSEYLAATSAQ